MARGRMISRTLSTSERRARLHDVAGKLAEFCQALYPLLIAHADDWGRQQGDAFTVKHAIDPSSPRKLADFDLALTCLHQVGLIEWYEVDGRRFIAITGFELHQDLHKRGKNSTFPEPSGIFPKVPETAGIPGSRARAEENRTEEKRTELKGTEPIQSPRADAETAEIAETDADLGQNVVDPRDIGRFLKRFCELYTRYRHGARYMVARARDVPNVRKLLLVHPLERLEKLALILLTTDDDWIAKTDRGIGILTLKAPWLDGLLAEHERKHGQVLVAS